MNPYAKMKAPTGRLRSPFGRRRHSRRQRSQRPRQGRAVRVGAGRRRRVRARRLGRHGQRRPLELSTPRTTQPARSRPRSKACRRRSGRSAGVMAISQQRLAKDKKDLLAYDPQLIADLEKIKLDPRPNTAKIFRVDYFRLPDADVDKLFNYYYDSIALYAEVERHIKKTQGRRGVAEDVRRRSAAQRDDEELRRRVRQQRRQADRRQPGRDRRSGLQGRRQGLPRHRHDRVQDPLEHRRAVGRSQVGRASWTPATSFR